MNWLSFIKNFTITHRIGDLEIFINQDNISFDITHRIGDLEKLLGV